MKSKTRLSIVLIVLAVLMAFAVSPAYAAQGTEPPASDLTLPTELQALIAAGVGYLVTQGLKSLSKLLGTDLSGWGSVIAASVVTTLVYFFNALLSAVPANAAPSLAIGLTLLVSILGAFGVHSTLKGLQPAARK